MTNENIQEVRKQTIEDFWEYYGGDNEWRHYDDSQIPGDEGITIYLEKHRFPEVGLVFHGDPREFILPDLWSAKVFGFFLMAVNLQNPYGGLAPIPYFEIFQMGYNDYRLEEF